MNQDYKQNRTLALKLVHGRIQELFLKNKEILEKHLTLQDREKLESLTRSILVPSHAFLTDVLNTLFSIFEIINKPTEFAESRRLQCYLAAWKREKS